MFPAGFGPAIPASERPQTHALDRAATGIGDIIYTYIILLLLFYLYKEFITYGITKFPDISSNFRIISKLVIDVQKIIYVRYAGRFIDVLIFFLLNLRAPQQMIRTHRSLEAYCAAL
jgi:hypothetical protein